jgi:hypothetical protein
VEIIESHSGLALTFVPSAPAALWALPLITISNSEAGYERNYQGAMVLLWWPLRLAPGEAWEQVTRCDVAGSTPRSR